MTTRNTTIINGGVDYDDTIIIYEDVNNVLISGFTITGRFINWGTTSGILIQGDNNSIQDNKIIFNHNGIVIDYHANNNIITNNIIAHNNVLGIYDCQGGSENTITWNVIGGNGRDNIYHEKGRSIYKEKDGGIFHHNDFDFEPCRTCFDWACGLAEFYYPEDKVSMKG